MSIFENFSAAPLAVRMRPQNASELVGQEDILKEGTPLRRLLDGDAKAAVSILLWGPPGSGKTTIAQMIASSSSRKFVELSAISSGVKDVREVIAEAKESISIGGQNTVLFIDEVHRFNKSQQDALLPAVENGWVTLVAATTENPSFSVNAPLLSRSIVVRLGKLSENNLADLIRRAIESESGLKKTVSINETGLKFLVRLAGGDARHALTLLEAAAGIALAEESEINEKIVSDAAQHAIVHYDKDGDQHYDIVSAFIKSMRGSDVDAALHYLARMIAAGEDPRFIARRIVILASEDIGMADPTALQTAMAAMQAVSLIGMPEASLTLAHAVIHASLAPKSNSVAVAIERAIADVNQGKGDQVPPALRDAHYSGATKMGHGVGYQYPHDLPNGVAKFEYLPSDLKNRTYYIPTEHGLEKRWGEILTHIKNLLKGDSVGSATESQEGKPL
ncbi:MAG: hypothetical protein RJA41_674 [Actinomycetota bacterium]